MDNNSFFAKGYVQGLLTVILLGVIGALVAYAHYTFKAAGGVYTGDVTISVQGEGEVLAKPDIGTFSFSVHAEGTDATEAQTKSAEATNAVLTYLKEQGIADKDVRTENYYLNPKYRYEQRICPANSYCPPGEPIIDGYEVSQTVTVKVRNLDDAGKLISGAGERGATNISGLQFTIDDETVLQAQAREKAIADAKEKAQALASDLGVKVVRMVGFYENNDGYYPMASKANMGYGGDAAMEMAIPPSVPTGENSIMSSVTITYEVR